MKYLIFLLTFLLFNCTSKNTNNTTTLFVKNQKDSLIILNAIFADMNIENLSKMPKSNYHFSCSLAPRDENILKISTDSMGKVLIDSFHNNNGIYNSVIQFYTVNRYNKNANYNYPFFSRMSKKEIRNKVFEVKKELIEIQNIENVNIDIVLYKKRKVNEWNNKLRAITVLKKDTLIEPSYSAYVKLEQDALYNPRLNNIVYKAYYHLRNELSIKHFNESYFRLFKRNAQKPNLIDSERLKALKLLQPIVFYDIEELKRKGLENAMKFIWSVPMIEAPPQFIEIK